MTKIFGFVLPGTEPEFDVSLPLAEPELEPFPLPGYLVFENFETLDLRPACCRIIPRRVLSGSDDFVAGPSQRRVFSSPAAVVNPPAESDPPAAVDLLEAEQIMPEVLWNRIVNQIGGGYGVRFVIKKKLYPTDTNSNENRFSMPEGKLSPEGMSFLTEAEEEDTRRRRDGNGDKGPILGMTVKLITPGGNLTTVTLKQWDYNFSKSFVFTGNWNNIVSNEKLHSGQIIRVWFFRSNNHEPCFAMINP